MHLKVAAEVSPIHPSPVVMDLNALRLDIYIDVDDWIHAGFGVLETVRDILPNH
jgi:hypothetical protein